MIRRLVQQINDFVFLDHDIEKLQVLIKVREQELENMKANLAHLLQKKQKKDLAKK